MNKFFEDQKAEIEAICGYKMSKIKKIDETISTLEKQLIQAKQDRKIMQNDINQLMKRHAETDDKINEMRLRTETAGIYARNTNGYVMQIIDRLEVSTTDEIIKIFKLHGKKQRHKSIYKSIDDLLKKEMIEEIKPFTYKLVDKQCKLEHN